MVVVGICGHALIPTFGISPLISFPANRPIQYEVRLLLNLHCFEGPEVCGDVVGNP
jgi:hypothetical protein